MQKKLTPYWRKAKGAYINMENEILNERKGDDTMSTQDVQAQAEISAEKAKTTDETAAVNPIVGIVPQKKIDEKQNFLMSAMALAYTCNKIFKNKIIQPMLSVEEFSKEIDLQAKVQARCAEIEAAIDDSTKIAPNNLKDALSAAETVCKILAGDFTAADLSKSDLLKNVAVCSRYGFLSDIAKDFMSAAAKVTDGNKIVEEINRIIETFSQNVAAQLEDLQNEIAGVDAEIAKFEQEKTAAIEKLKSAENFSQDVVFADDLLTAAAFAKLFDSNAFVVFKAAIQNWIKQHNSTSYLKEWLGEVRDKTAEIKARQADLLARRNVINAKVVSAKFFAAHTELNNFVEPAGFQISENGVEKIVGEKSFTVARIPAVIQSKLKNVEEKTFKFVLAYLSENGKWQTLPATGAEVIADSRKLITFAAYGLPITSYNANLFVDYLDAFKAANEKTLPLAYNFSRCGWYTFGDKDYFIDPRRNCTILDNQRNVTTVVDDSSIFAQSLKSVGSLAEWRKAYELAENSPVARAIIAACVATPLLKVLDVRNFLLYVYAKTRAGKTTAMYLGASAIGDEKIIRSFDATKNGLAGAAADVNDYAFLVDEKQVADNRLQDQFDNLVYALGNGIGRTKLNKDSTLKKLQDWRTIVIMTGETPLLDDNVTGGAYTRLLSIHAPNVILDDDTCKQIRQIIKKNYGLVFPLVIDKIFEVGFDKLLERYNRISSAFKSKYPELLNVYCEYMATLTLADALLSEVLGSSKEQADESAVNVAVKVFELIPTIEEIDDAQREKDFVLGFIAAKAAQFERSETYKHDSGREVLGRVDDDFVYITARALQQACNESHFDRKKLVADLVETKFFIPDDKILKDRKNADPCIQKKIIGTNTRCYRMPRKIVKGES